jgi:hypothetical protein
MLPRAFVDLVPLEQPPEFLALDLTTFSGEGGLAPALVKQIQLECYAISGASPPS